MIHYVSALEIFVVDALYKFTFTYLLTMSKAFVKSRAHILIVEPHVING